ncbi:hypothetical protein VIBNISOn1_p0003 [Vibrio nigripulchritudo SOn1]|uniref:Uncharacterized protein n=1 Tax=Vibrio nigripulchritudo SOn1 TaxID=1238450 RepID=A0AAV2VZV9_9VIBR|nr:hypothetical protein VIBNISOn1_p0003 [Vibrio nigripulchritudo SOn1]
MLFEELFPFGTLKEIEFYQLGFSGIKGNFPLTMRITPWVVLE